MGNVKMQKIDLCVIQDDDLAQVFLDMDQRPAVKTVVVIDQIVPPNSPKVSALHKALREKAEKEGLDFYYGKGMCAELLANGLLKADESAVVCDKAAGAAGAVGAKVFLADAVQLKQVLETGELSQERSAEDSESKKNVVKTTVLMQNIGDFGAMNEVYAEYFIEECPARAAYEVAKLPKGALVEIEAIAYVK